MTELRCDGCGEPITGDYVFHARLGAYVHFKEECMRDVRGEDIRGHTVRLVTDPPAN